MEQDSDGFEEDVKKLVSMGFEKVLFLDNLKKISFANSLSFVKKKFLLF